MSGKFAREFLQFSYLHKSIIFNNNYSKLNGDSFVKSVLYASLFMQVAFQAKREA